LREFHCRSKIPINTTTDNDSSGDDTDMDSDYEDVWGDDYYYGINSTAAIHQMFARLHKLEVISFQSLPLSSVFHLSDESLAVIGANCPLLRYDQNKHKKKRRFYEFV
jgi:hypothetical protein